MICIKECYIFLKADSADMIKRYRMKLFPEDLVDTQTEDIVQEHIRSCEHAMEEVKKRLHQKLEGLLNTTDVIQR